MDIWKLWQEAESICATIKHNSENLDLDHVRMTMRRTQYLIDAISPLLTLPTNLTVQTQGDEFLVSIAGQFGRESYRDLLAIMSGNDYTD
jgi:hypothetical protein